MFFSRGRSPRGFGRSVLASLCSLSADFFPSGPSSSGCSTLDAEASSTRATRDFFLLVRAIIFVVIIVIVNGSFRGSTAFPRRSSWGYIRELDCDQITRSKGLPGVDGSSSSPSILSSISISL